VPTSQLRYSISGLHWKKCHEGFLVSIIDMCLSWAASSPQTSSSASKCVYNLGKDHGKYLGIVKGKSSFLLLYGQEMSPAQ
jgi:hypothetical protein